MQAIIRSTRGQLSDLYEAFSQAALTSCGETDDPDLYRKFKYACGRNYDTVRRLMDESHKRQRSLIRSNPRYDELLAKRHQLAESMAARDEKGDVKIDRTNPDAPEYVFTAENEKAFTEAVTALDAEYADAMAARAENAKELEAVMGEVIDVPVFKFPFSKVPSRMAGGWMVAIACMLDGIPEEFAEAPAAPALSLVPDEVAAEAAPASGAGVGVDRPATDER